MKKLFVTIAMVLFANLNLFAQGKVILQNSSSTRVTLDNQPTVYAGSAYAVALYYAADGVTDESVFVRLGASATLTSGVFAGGGRTAPVTPPGGFGMFQVRGWTSGYGSSYEACLAGPRVVQNKVGKSAILRVDTSDPTSVPPETAAALTSFGLQSFSLTALPFPHLDVSEPLVFEGNDDTTNLVFQVTLVGGSNDVVSVDFSTLDNTASAGSDYVSTNGTLVFQPGESNKTVTVTVFGDTQPENDEVVLLTLSNPTNAIVLSQGAGTIYNDDCATSVALAFYPGVTINGCAGKPYEIQVAFDSNPNQWTTVTNLVLPSTPYLWFDTISSLTGNRYYRTILLPP